VKILFKNERCFSLKRKLFAVVKTVFKGTWTSRSQSHNRRLSFQSLLQRFPFFETRRWMYFVVGWFFCAAVGSSVFILLITEMQ
jgi:hypothetical protein